MMRLIRGVKGGIIFLLVFVQSVDLYAGMIDKEGMAPWEICGLCHGLDGISATGKFPKLAGQKPAYIKKQFLAFNKGVRSNDGGQMVAITTEVNLATLDDIANYFAGLAPPLPVPKDGSVEQAANFEKGQELFMRGRVDLPACVGCHGRADSTVPWLYSQHASYLSKQLNDFKTGLRVDPRDSAMSVIASLLNEQDIEALATYLELTGRNP